ncbi:cell morphogenesis protein-like protein Las1 [Setomelanomma holmii]|uniref:Cell morphogenesis protein-like protein Las1 n=1 Tax=Setomelanomma holmii TaxID=210430 RepID=A0A9P4H3P0_9PLEO|nr:cell morphogenesis protein-like protein Las1 [Setomelanomma holmii]
MDPPRRQFVVTPWRNRQELLQLRHDLYGSDATKKERAVNKVFAWRLRKPEGLPLLLDSSADIIDVILQDQKNELKHNALRLLYATALSRFITGLADTQIDLIRDKPAWFPPGKSLQLPTPLLELRHRIVHRHLPSLAELKRAAQDSLNWLWEWYWSQLDYAFGIVKPDEGDAQVESTEAIKEKLQMILKTYVKERKSEIKSRKKESKAAETAVSAYHVRYSPSSTLTPVARTQNLLLRLLIDEKMILPADKKLGSSMSGAFLIWDPALLALCPSVMPVSSLLAHLMSTMNAPYASRSMVSIDMDPVAEGIYDWVLHLLCSSEWQATRARIAANLVEETLIQCFSEPTFWNLRVAVDMVKDEAVANREQWLAVLEAAKMEGQVVGDRGEDDAMDVDVEGIEEGLPVSDTSIEKDKEKAVKEKIRGPTKVLGMWKPRPIGWLPEGWEHDE